MYKKILGAIVLGMATQTLAIAQEAAMTPLRPDQVSFLAAYKELVETNTTLSAGNCTLAAEKLAAHLKAAAAAPMGTANWSLSRSRSERRPLKITGSRRSTRVVTVRFRSARTRSAILASK